jgi:hypothetical protein
MARDCPKNVCQKKNKKEKGNTNETKEKRKRWRVLGSMSPIDKF